MAVCVGPLIFWMTEVTMKAIPSIAAGAAIGDSHAPKQAAQTAIEEVIAGRRWRITAICAAHSAPL
jgi:hypothetical protein